MADLVESYIRTYYNNINIDSDNFKFQELIRKLDAAHYYYGDKPAVVNGSKTLHNIVHEYKKYKLDTGLIEIIYDSIYKEPGTTARTIVKPILTYPYASMAQLSWNILDIDMSRYESLTTGSYKFAIADNKLYLLTPNLVDILYRYIQHSDFVSKYRLVKQTNEVGHLTIVNSDKFNRQLAESVLNIVIDDLQITEFKHTIALDWAPHSIVLVAGVKSNKLNEVITRLNVSVSAHITVAILRR